MAIVVRSDLKLRAEAYARAVALAPTMTARQSVHVLEALASGLDARNRKKFLELCDRINYS